MNVAELAVIFCCRVGNLISFQEQSRPRLPIGTFSPPKSVPPMRASSQDIKEQRSMYRRIGTVSNGIPRDRSRLTQFLGKTWRSLRSVAQHVHQRQDPLSKAMGSKKVWIGPGCGRSLGPQWNG